MPLMILPKDITQMNVDAIVNAANNRLTMGDGVCGAIFKAAGVEKLQAFCKKRAFVKTGHAVITPGFNLPSRYIVHAVGPVYNAHDAARCEKLLFSTYTRALRLARWKGCESVAFPLISSGIYGYPKEEALRIAKEAITAYLRRHPMDVYLTLVDKAFVATNPALIRAVKQYVHTHYVKPQPPPIISSDSGARYHIPSIRPGKPYLFTLSTEQERKLLSRMKSDFVGEIEARLQPSFQTMLFDLIRKKQLSDVEVYTRANLDRRLFSKIRSGQKPSKRTAISLAIALELTPEETHQLLQKAGYALSNSFIFDCIILYFIESGNYDVFEINKVLFELQQPLLGAH